MIGDCRMKVENLVYRTLSAHVGKRITVDVLEHRSYAGILQDFSMSAILLKIDNSPSNYVLLPVDTILSISYMEDS